MENNSNEQEDQDKPSPSLNGHSMDHNSWRGSYIDDQIYNHEKLDGAEEDEHADGPYSKLPQRIIAAPDGDKESTEIKAENESAN